MQKCKHMKIKLGYSLEESSSKLRSNSDQCFPCNESSLE